MSTWYLSTVGSDTTGDGSIGNPYATIEKCVTESSNGDSIKYADGTYSISSTANINKQLTISGHTGIPASVILDSTVTVFNVQESNVSFDNLTMDTTNTTPLVTFDRSSTGTTEPTFTIGNSIDNCIIKFIKNALTLNGEVSVTNNTFTRNDSGSETADIITVYSIRNALTVSNNTLTSDAYAIRYFIWFTSTGTGDYVDWANSKSGVVTISTNSINSTDTTQLLTFMQLDYFNQYDYGPNAVSVEAYNTNTKVRMVVDNNTMSMGDDGKFINILINDSSNFYMFDHFNIHTNTITSEHGVVHLDKDVGTTSAITVDIVDQARSIVKIYNNTITTFGIIGPLPASALNYDTSISSSLFRDLGKTTNSLVDNGVAWDITVMVNQSDVTGDAIDDSVGQVGEYKSDTLDSTPANYQLINSGYKITASPLLNGFVDLTFVFVVQTDDDPFRVLASNVETGSLSQSNAIYITTSSGKLRVLLYDNSLVETDVYTTATFNNVERFCGVFQIDSSQNTIKMWLNGVKETFPYTGSITPLDQSFFLLKYNLATGSGWNGNFYECMVYPSILSDGHVTEVTNSLQTKWNFNYIAAPSFTPPSGIEWTLSADNKAGMTFTDTTNYNIITWNAVDTGGSTVFTADANYLVSSNPINYGLDSNNKTFVRLNGGTNGEITATAPSIWNRTTYFVIRHNDSLFNDWNNILKIGIQDAGSIVLFPRMNGTFSSYTASLGLQSYINISTHTDNRPTDSTTYDLFQPNLINIITLYVSLDIEDLYLNGTRCTGFPFTGLGRSSASPLCSGIGTDIMLLHTGAWDFYEIRTYDAYHNVSEVGAINAELHTKWGNTVVP